MFPKLTSLLLAACSLCISCGFVSCRAMKKPPVEPEIPPRAVVRDGVAITLRDQKLTVFSEGRKVKDYDISSSKFGVGSKYGSNRTPVGIHAVTKKVGEGQPAGMVFKGCRPTGEVVSVNAEGRDPIVTRVIQLSGLEGSNRNSHSRRIYIHGTPEERNIGHPASYGCIRMRSEDVIDLYRRVHRGMPVAIEECSQAMYLSAEQSDNFQSIAVPDTVVASLPKESASGRAIARRGNKAKFRPSARRGSKASGRRLASRKTRGKARGLATRSKKRS